MKKLRWVLSNIPEIISGTAFIVMITVVALNVLLRYIFSTSLLWGEEVAALGFVWSIFLGAAVCYKRRNLISIDMLVTALPGSIRRNLQLVLYVFMVIVNLVLCYLSLQFSISAWAKVSLSLRIPYTFFDAGTFVGFAFMSGYAVRDLVWEIRGKQFFIPGEEQS